MLSAALTPAQNTGTPRFLNATVATWFTAALLGQLAFFSYIVAFYGSSLLEGNFEAWNRLQAMGRTPFIAGDATGNWVFLTHALGAGLVVIGGVLQLIPVIRKRAPRLHRWNGRIFLTMVTVLSLSGFYLEWIRDDPPTTLSGFATTINGVLILSFAYMTLKAARARRFADHRRWAIRLFLVSNAQWFTRVGLFAYLVMTQVLGTGSANVGTFFEVWKFGAFLVPLAVAELYLQCANQRPAFKAGVAMVMAVLTLFMSVGIVAYGAFTLKIATGAPLSF
ncbi:MAG: DUF2306 domain-containing protein [Rhodanobacteraceae bacterium]|nr:DUF2306 domain-containing protein [Rhodanobacteraceae bacterium]